MPLADTVDQVLPVITLLIGAGLTRVGKRGEARRVAGEQMAELHRPLWTKGGEGDYIDLRVFLGRLHVALRAAGVPERLAKELRDAALQYWQAIEYHPEMGDGDEGGWGITHGRAHERFETAEAAVLDWLDRPWHLVRRARAWRAISSVQEKPTA